MATAIDEFFSIVLKTQPGEQGCIGGLNEDSLRALISIMGVTVSDSNFGGFVLSSNGIRVKFNFGADGNFTGVTAQIDGKQVVLIPGTSSGTLSTFEGPPTGSNPGPGWQIEVDLTKKYLAQSGPESGWEIFYARRIPILNTFGTP